MLWKEGLEEAASRLERVSWISFIIRALNSFISVHDLKGLVEEESRALCSELPFNAVVAHSERLYSNFQFFLLRWISEWRSFLHHNSHKSTGQRAHFNDSALAVGYLNRLTGFNKWSISSLTH